MSPPRTSVWLLSSTTEVSASRLVKRGELVGRRLVFADLVDLLLDVEGHRALLADARGDGEDDAGVLVLDGLRDRDCR